MSSTSDALDDVLDDLNDLDIDDYLDDDSSGLTYGDTDSSIFDDDDDIFGSDYDIDDIDTSGDIYGDPPPGLGAVAIGSDFGSGTSSSCISEVAFKTTGARVDLAFDVIFLVLFIALAGLAGFGMLKSKRKDASLGLQWLLFPVSLFFAILYLFIDMLTLILAQCVMMRYEKYQQALIATRWLEQLSYFILIVILLLPICLKLQKGSGKLASLTLIVHSAWLALCGIFLVVSLAVYSKVFDALYRTGDVIELDLVRALKGTTMVYFVFLFLAALLGGANMFFALFRKNNLRKGTLLLAIPILGISTLILTLVLMGGFADLYYGSATRSLRYYERSQDAQDWLVRMFYAVAFVAALGIASSRQETDEAASVEVNAPPMNQNAPPVPAATRPAN